ncbi:glycosyltransferase family 2 protein [Terricaulis sp.]|uniref:glycosyltransferase family 2 protein n=1 Tax=Terricaulis sp. TaxID=2768686 RepID=UPI0037843455
MARVDVLMPAYNAAATIRAAIESIRVQTFADWRLVVVDDGSTDQTPAILAELAAADRRIHVITKANEGIVEARNDALRAADAEFIACLDSDDIALPARFERQLTFLAVRPDCVAVGGAVEHMDEEGRPISGMTQSGPPMDADAEQAPALEPYIVHSTLMARRADIVAVGGYRHVPNSEDSDLFWRLMARGTLVNLAETFAKYRVHTQSISSSIVNGRIMAVGSQLGALSARRREAGKPDLEFPRALHEAMKRAVTLAAMVELASPKLDEAEAKYLRVAAACKLMELARYRPYEPDVTDCAFIRAALPAAKSLSAQNQREVAWYITVTAARLVRKGLLREAMTLTPLKNYPVTAARVVMAR